MKTFMDNISLANGKWRKQYAITLVVLGLVVGVFVTDWSDKTNWLFYITAYCLGVPCVVSLADRYPKMGNILGISSNVGEIIINTMFGNFGLAFAGIYYGITHIIGLKEWTKESNQDEDGRIKVGKMNAFWVLFTLAFTIVGLIVLIMYGDKIGFTTDGSLMGNIMYWGNIIAYLLGIVSQFLMIMRIDFSWWGWFASNFFWFLLDFGSGNYWFAIRDVLYQTNVVTAIYAWYDESGKLTKGKNKELA